MRKLNGCKISLVSCSCFTFLRQLPIASPRLLSFWYYLQNQHLRPKINKMYFRNEFTTCPVQEFQRQLLVTWACGAACLSVCHCLGSCWQGVWDRISIAGIWRLLDKGQYLLLVQTLCWRNKGEGCTEVVLRLWGCAWNSERGFYWDLQKKHTWFLKNSILIFILHFFWNGESSWIGNCLLVRAITVITGQVTIGLLELKVYS